MGSRIMTKRSKVNERRRKLYKRITKGEDLKEVAKQLADQYSVSLETVRNEWYEREKWISEVFHFDKPEAIFDDLVAEKKEAKKKLWNVIESIKTGEKDNYNNLIRAIDSLNKTNDELLKAFQSHGDIPKEPDRKEISVEGSLLDRARDLIEEEEEEEDTDE